MPLSDSVDLFGLPLLYRRTRAYAAPVIRATDTPTIFDPTSSYDWNADRPTAPWIDLGWVNSLTSTSESVIGEVSSGAPAAARFQVRRSLGATVSCEFLSWNKITMALASGSQHLNVLASGLQVALASIGAPASAAVSLKPETGASTLYLDAPADSVPVGSYVVIDDDYAAQSGFVGAGLSGSYIGSNIANTIDVDYIRRISFNVGQVCGITADGALQLSVPLLAGVPTATMKLQRVNGFITREGGCFFQEWSALFIRSGVQGDKSFIYYPRLQSNQNAREIVAALAPNLHIGKLGGNYRALPIIDAYDGEQVLSYSSFMQKPLAAS